MSYRNAMFWALGAFTITACGSADDGQGEGSAVSSGPEALHSTLEALDRVPTGYGVVPGGFLVHKDCIHEVPEGAIVETDDSLTLKGKTIARYGPCAHKRYRLAQGGSRRTAEEPGTGNGWVESNWGTSSQTMFTNLYTGTWTVPGNPTANDGQLLYFFPSLVSSTWDTIVQDVMQWGSSPAGGGQNWGMATWKVGGGQTYHSTLRTVYAGDQLNGHIQIIGSDATSQTWFIGMVDATRLTYTYVTAKTNTNPFSNVQGGVLEAYGVTQCSDFPSSGPTYFSAVTLYQGNSYTQQNLYNPSWTTQPYTYWGWTGPTCSLSVSTGTQGEAWLYY